MNESAEASGLRACRRGLCVSPCLQSPATKGSGRLPFPCLQAPGQGLVSARSDLIRPRNHLALSTTIKKISKIRPSTFSRILGASNSKRKCFGAPGFDLADSKIAVRARRTSACKRRTVTWTRRTCPQDIQKCCLDTQNCSPDTENCCLYTQNCCLDT